MKIQNSGKNCAWNKFILWIISLPSFVCHSVDFHLNKEPQKLTNTNIKFIFGCGWIIELCASVFAKDFRVWKLSVWFTVYIFESIILFIHFFAYTCMFPALLLRLTLILSFTSVLLHQWVYIIVCGFWSSHHVLLETRYSAWKLERWKLNIEIWLTTGFSGLD